ncbi:Folate-biopterin transporter, partial [Globisporangium splendens]
MEQLATKDAELLDEKLRAMKPQVKHVQLKQQPDDEDDADAAPQTPTEETGALREGGAPHLLSRESIGLLAQYAAVGLVYGTLPNTIMPFLTYYLNMEGTTTTSARALLGIPWSLKVFIGILSDCAPIGGYRRRPYMVLGWTVAATCLYTMAYLPLGRPYFSNPELRTVKPESYTLAQIMSLNKEAPNSGAAYIVLMMLATLGYLFADVAADAIVVEYAQREPIATRGRTQTAIYSVRFFFGIFAQMIVGFGLSSPEYGGDFGFGISFPVTMFILATFCVPVIPMTWYLVREQQVDAPVFKTYLNDLWLQIQNKAVYQVIAYSFFSGVFSGFSYVASDPITSYWVHATSFNLCVSGIIGSGVMVATLVFTGKYGLDWNWRTMQVVTTVVIVSIDASCTMVVTWDYVRSKWFWLGLPIAESVPAGMSFLISTYVVVELAGKGHEGAIYGLLTTVGNLGGPFALTLTKNVNASFKVHNEDIMNDSYEVRRDVTITILISYTMKLLALAFLPWLPRQKAETQELKRTGGSNRTIGAITIAYLVFALLWSILSNLLSIFESTRCLAITGGCQE